MKVERGKHNSSKQNAFKQPHSGAAAQSFDPNAQNEARRGPAEQLKHRPNHLQHNLVKAVCVSS